MIKFTELRVHKGHLLITAEVRDLDYYDNVYISQIKIDSQDTFTSSGPSSNLIYTSATYTNQKTVTLDLEANDFSAESIDMNKTMFFVYAIATGTPSSDTPCGFDNTVSMGVTFSMCPIYNQTMQYVKEVENSCELPSNFIDMILQHKAIEYSINSGHFTQAIIFYKKLYNLYSVSAVNSCGCNGRYIV